MILYVMNEIRIPKIDWVEFVTYKDYLRLKEIAHNELEELKEAAETIKELEEENENLNKQIEQFKKWVKAWTNIIERLEEENQKLKDEVDFWGTQANKHQKERIEQHDRIINKMKKIEELKAENKKLKYVIDSVMEKADIEYVRLADWDVFTNPKNKLHISDTIQIDILNGK